MEFKEGDKVIAISKSVLAESWDPNGIHRGIGIVKSSGRYYNIRFPEGTESLLSWAFSEEDLILVSDRCDLFDSLLSDLK